MRETAKLYNHLKMLSTLADFRQWSRPLDDLGGGGGLKPLNVSISGRVIAGTVGGIMPTISGTPLDDSPAPLLTIPTSGTQYVRLNISGTLSKQTYSGSSFVTSAFTALTATITVTTTAPSISDSSSTTGSYKIYLATFVDGLKTLQNGYGPIGLTIQDKLDGSGTGILVTNYPGV